MVMSECPIYRETAACDRHLNCVFQRTGGCAVILGAMMAEESQKKINALAARVDDLASGVNRLVQLLQRR